MSVASDEVGSVSVEQLEGSEMTTVDSRDVLLREHANAHEADMRRRCTSSDSGHITAIRQRLGDFQFCVFEHKHLPPSIVLQLMADLQDRKGTEEQAHSASSSRRRRRKGR